MKIRVARVDHLDSVLSHENGDMQVRDEIPTDLWNFIDDFGTNILV